MPHTELLLRVNIHWLFVNSLMTYAPLKHLHTNLLFSLPQNKNTLFFFLRYFFLKTTVNSSETVALQLGVTPPT